MEIDLPDQTPEYEALGFKGGNNFTKLADRALGITVACPGIGPVQVFVIHASAAKTSAK